MSSSTINLQHAEPDFVRAVCLSDATPATKESILKILGISKIVLRQAPNEAALDNYFQTLAQICENAAREQGFLAQDYTEKDFRKFVESFEWTFAKTFAKTSPHEYIIIQPNHPRRQEFLSALNFLFHHGVREKYYDKAYDRYFLDGRTYWSMEQSWDDVDDETIVLNRTQPDKTFTVYEKQKSEN